MKIGESVEISEVLSVTTEPSLNQFHWEHWFHSVHLFHQFHNVLLGLHVGEYPRSAQI